MGSRRELIFGALGLGILSLVVYLLVSEATREPDPNRNISVTPTVTAEVTQDPVNSPTPNETPTPNPQTYTVHAGDTLNGIAERFNISLANLAAKNSIMDPNNIYAGQKLQLPEPGEQIQASTPSNGEPGEAVHVVKSGDTLFAIAQEYGVTTRDIIELNGDIDPQQLYLGRNLRIPTRPRTPPAPREVSTAAIGVSSPR
jgi:LysM repeat protein